ncbi:MAG TPA: hypothetical protein VKB12_21070 [Pyrinomonadaceae bacterium]|nr:hypothetical protein [Pyrinomonadaceae bacterium]
MTSKCLSKPAAAVAALLLLCGLARAQETREVEITDGALNISFAPPPGCNALPEKAMAAAFAGQPVKYGCVTPGEGTSVFVLVSASDGTKRGFADFERGFKDGVKQGDPAVRFKRRVVSLNGDKWVVLSYTQGRGDAAVANDVYMIDWAGHVVVFDFLAPPSKYESSRAAREESAKSVGMSITVNAPAAAATPDTPGGTRQN